MTHENKFGMFIHWGLYAVTELQDQAIIRYQLPRKEYEGLISAFNPVNYDPESWVLLAKEAGMEYICFTTKHHDGFCMWDTKYTDYSIMHTPYGKDALKQLHRLSQSLEQRVRQLFANLALAVFDFGKMTERAKTTRQIFECDPLMNTKLSDKPPHAVRCG